MRFRVGVVLQHPGVVAILLCPRDDLLSLLDSPLGVRILSGLQVRVEEEVHRMQFVAARIHSASILRLNQCNRFQVRLNVLLPES